MFNSIFIALVEADAVDAKVLKKDNEWVKQENGEIYIGIFQTDYDNAYRQAAAKSGVDKEHIHLIELVSRGGM